MELRYVSRKSYCMTNLYFFFTVVPDLRLTSMLHKILKVFSYTRMSVCVCVCVPDSYRGQNRVRSVVFLLQEEFWNVSCGSGMLPESGESECVVS